MHSAISEYDTKVQTFNFWENPAPWNYLLLTIKAIAQNTINKATKLPGVTAIKHLIFYSSEGTQLF